jgi:hypothetical protein
MRRSRVISCLASSTQQMNSLRARGRDVHPGIERRSASDQCLAQVWRQLVHHPTRHLLAGHRITVANHGNGEAPRARPGCSPRRPARGMTWALISPGGALPCYCWMWRGLETRSQPGLPAWLHRTRPAPSCRTAAAVRPPGGHGQQADGENPCRQRHHLAGCSSRKISRGKGLPSGSMARLVAGNGAK